MKFINLYAIVLSIMLMLPQFIAAGENNNPAALPFKVVNIPGNDIPDNLNTESISKIKQPLQNEGYYLDEYRPGFDESINFENCIKRDCGHDIKEYFPGKIVIIISIISSEVKTGEKRISRYLVEDITETRYTIYVFTDNPGKDKYDLTFKKTFLDPPKLLKEAEVIGLKIGEFYSGK